MSFTPDADPGSTTDPTDPDSDDDGLLDGQEDTNGDGASPRVIGDTGTTGSGETDPNDPDTDDDGLTDGQEENVIGSDPLDTDTDDGTVDDGTEVGQGTNPVNNPGDDIIAPPNVARIVGADRINEYRTDIDPLGAEREKLSNPNGRSRPAGHDFRGQHQGSSLPTEPQARSLRPSESVGAQLHQLRDTRSPTPIHGTTQSPRTAPRSPVN